MKKILILLMLLLFSAIQLSWAGDVILIGSDGQARYEDEFKQKKQDVESDKTMNYIGNLSAIENKFQKYIDEAPKVLNEYNQILLKYGYNFIDNSSESNKEYIALKLKDGDYAILFANSPYAAEYHKNKALMGLIKSEVINKDNTGFTQIYYEYRIDEELLPRSNKGNGAMYPLDMKMKLKHIMVIDYHGKNDSSQYIYDKEGNLLCSQIGDDIYVSEGFRNLLPDWSTKTIHTKDTVLGYAYTPAPGTVVKKKRNTPVRRVIKEAATPFTVISGLVGIIGVIPVYFANIGSVNGAKTCEKFLMFFLAPYEYFEDFTEDKRYE